MPNKATTDISDTVCRLGFPAGKLFFIKWFNKISPLTPFGRNDIWYAVSYYNRLDMIDLIKNFNNFVVVKLFEK